MSGETHSNQIKNSHFVWENLKPSLYSLRKLHTMTSSVTFTIFLMYKFNVHIIKLFI